MKELKTLIEHIKSLTLYKELLFARERIISHQEYIETYHEIQKIQKELVHFEYYGKSEKIKETRLEYETRLEALMNEYIVSEYLRLLTEFTSFIHEIENIFNTNLGETLLPREI